MALDTAGAHFYPAGASTLHVHHPQRPRPRRNPFAGSPASGERITPRTLIAAAVILTAVILVITAPHPAPAHETDAVPAPGEA